MSSVVFSIIRCGRSFAEFFIPERFSSRDLYLARDASDGQPAIVRIWGNANGYHYLSQRLSELGAGIESAALPQTSRKPSMRFVWHNRLRAGKFRQGGWIVLPGLVSSRIDLSMGIKAVKKRFSRSARRASQATRDAGYWQSIVPCDGFIERFYHEMYGPYCESRFAGNEIVKSLTYVKSLARDSVLMLLFDNARLGRPVSFKGGSSLQDALGGVMIHEIGTCASLVISGVHGEARAAMRRGVIESLYGFAIEWCCEQGFQSLDLGVSHPFLLDGILRFKSKWGASVAPCATGVHDLAVRFENGDWLGREFLRDHPLIVQDGGKLAGLVHLPGEELRFSELAAAKRRLLIDGLERLIVVSDVAAASDAEGLVSEIGNVELLPCYDLRYLGRMCRVSRILN
ncbi:hypothetical protein J7M28_00900 [bacterium]|nr:hypothetical protein [bacterium]